MSANTVDPNLKNDTTDEFIVGLDHEIGAGFAVGANYIWRRYGELLVERPRRHHGARLGRRYRSRRRPHLPRRCPARRATARR